MKAGSGLKPVAPINVDDTLRADYSLSKSIAKLNATEELLLSAHHPPPCLKRPPALQRSADFRLSLNFEVRDVFLRPERKW